MNHVLRNRISAGLHTLLALWLLTAGAALWAQEASNSYDTGLKLSGYASLIYSHDSQDGMGLRRDFTQTENWNQTGSFRPDSRLGLQANYQWHPQWEVAGQITVKDRGNKSDAGVEWALLGWQPAAGLSVRAGRLPLDLFMMSAYQGLGYAYTSIRPPTEFYAVWPLSSLNGMDLSWQISQENSFWRVKMQLGNVTSPVVSSQAVTDTMVIKKVQNFVLEYEHGPWRIRGGRANSRVNLPASFVQLGQLAQAGIPGVSADLQNFMQPLAGADYIKTRYTSVGVSYTGDDWLFQGEWSQVNGLSTMIPLGRQMYAQVGRRVGNVLPYVIWAKATPSSAPFAFSNDWSAMAGGNQVRDRIEAAVNTFRISTQTVSLGMRWDYNSQTAVKVQWDHTRLNPQGYAPWAVNPSLLDGRTSVNVWSVGLDYVF